MTEEITDATVAETGAIVVGVLTGELVAPSIGEEFAATMIEIREVIGDASRRIDGYLRGLAAPAVFYERAGQRLELTSLSRELDSGGWLGSSSWRLNMLDR